MSAAKLRASPAAPTSLSLALQALWWDATGNWEQAHRCAQDQDDRTGAAVHAYLHRKEGDIPNARYWYARAGRPLPDLSLDAEWEHLADEISRHETAF